VGGLCIVVGFVFGVLFFVVVGIVVGEVVFWHFVGEDSATGGRGFIQLQARDWDNSVIAYSPGKTEAETNIRAIIGRWAQVLESGWRILNRCPSRCFV
jgi:hypothetical protein